MGEKVVARGRVWISTYNCWPKKFNNGIVWFRFTVKLRDWHDCGGLWFSRHVPFFKLLRSRKGCFRRGYGPIKPLPLIDLDTLDLDEESLYYSPGGDEEV